MGETDLTPSSTRALIDKPVSVTLRGVRPGQPVGIKATMRDAVGVHFASSANFLADAEGLVDTRRSPALGGTYLGVDEGGLWWSMVSDGCAEFTPGWDPITATVSAETSDGRLIAMTSLHRLPADPAGTRVEVGEAGVVGVLAVPPSGRGPGVVVLGGSGGGLEWSEERAALLASRGVTALALAYFGIEGRPPHLVDIPIECVLQAVCWLRRHEAVVGDRLGLVGSSRGAELALLAASWCDQVGPVVAYSPSVLTWSGFDPTSDGHVHAWTRKGVPFPVPAPSDETVMEQALQRSPIALVDVFSSSLRDEARATRALIEVERIRGPVMLVSGDDDGMWPASRMAEMAIRRLGEMGHPFSDCHLRYAGAGHAVSQLPGAPASPTAVRHPVDGNLYELGGFRAANAHAAADAWARVVPFLHAHLVANASCDGAGHTPSPTRFRANGRSHSPATRRRSRAGSSRDD